MKLIIYLILGIWVGILIVKAEVISWYRLQEALHFDSFHLYGVYLSAVITASLSIWILKLYKFKTLEKKPIVIPVKVYQLGIIGGGLMFGMGWAMAGASPGMSVGLLGIGLVGAFILFLSVLLGIWLFHALLYFMK